MSTRRKEQAGREQGGNNENQAEQNISPVEKVKNMGGKLLFLPLHLE